MQELGWSWNPSTTPATSRPQRKLSDLFPGREPTPSSHPSPAGLLPERRQWRTNLPPHPPPTNYLRITAVGVLQESRLLHHPNDQTKRYFSPLFFIFSISTVDLACLAGDIPAKNFKEVLGLFPCQLSRIRSRPTSASLSWVEKIFSSEDCWKQRRRRRGFQEGITECHSRQDSEKDVAKVRIT